MMASAYRVGTKTGGNAADRDGKG